MTVGENDLVLINYTIRVVEGDKKVVYDTTIEEVAKKEGIYDDSRVYRPIPVVLGRSALIEAVEEALKTMKEGEKRVIIAPPEKAYGPYDENLVKKIPIKTLRKHNIVPRVGMEIEVNGRKGRIVRVTQRFAFVDFNHPLAGKTLEIELEVVKIIRSDDEKIKYLASRVFRIDPEAFKVEATGENEYRLVLPVLILQFRDLEALLATMLEYIYTYTNTKKLELVIPVEFKRKEPEQQEQQAKPAASGESAQQ